MGSQAGILALIFSFNPRNGWVDNLRFYVFFFFFFVFFNIIPVISGRWEEDKYKAVCNGTAT